MSVVLVTGGAGYIGRHLVHDLVSQGYVVDVLDLTIPQPHLEVHGVRNYIRGDIREIETTNRVLSRYRYNGVFHLAGKKSVPKSYAHPELFMTTNVLGTENLINGAIHFGVERFVFASSCSVYGDGRGGAVGENAKLSPISPYALSKLRAEEVILAKSNSIKVAILRFFNVIGSSNRLWRDESEDSLVPSTFKSISSGKRPTIYGTSYPTVDGTAIRDFVDVRDLCRVHISVMELLSSIDGVEIINVGVGKGRSVKEVVESIFLILNRDFQVEFKDARLGDPAAIWADTSKLTSLLGQVDFIDLEQSLKSCS